MPDAAAAPLADLLAAARAWAADDPDAVTRAELEGLAAAAEGGDDAAATELADAMSGLLEFGTAGLRGAPRRRPQPDEPRGGDPRGGRAHGLPEDARPRAVRRRRLRRPHQLRRVRARHLRGRRRHGGRASVLPHPLPTPVLAYAIRHLGADAGVMVTASHNPPEDNGYKVYVGDGSQIVPPVDAADRRRDRAVAVGGVGADGRRRLAHPRRLGARGLPRRRAHASCAGQPARGHRRAHRPARGGVGDGAPGVPRGRVSRAPIPVASQAEPDPMFPTVSFPNPEEPGAMDAALELAEQTNPDVVIANDPDADRCAVAVPGPGGWRMLRGDEVGALLGSHVLSRGAAGGVVPDSADCVFANSIVSSRLLAAMCRGGRGAARGDADRVQVDRAGAGAALRLRGGARLLRRPGAGARQGRRLRGAAGGRAGRDAEDAGPLARRPARRPGPRARGLRHRRVLGAGGRTCR